MWKNSFNADNTVGEEWSGVFSSDGNGKLHLLNVKTDHDSGMSYPNYNVPTGHRLIGHIHTHPYSKPEGFDHNMAHSLGNVWSMRNNPQNYINMVNGGGRLFALVITDYEKAQSFFSKYNKESFKAEFANMLIAEQFVNGDLPNSQILSNVIRNVIGSDNGISFYRTNDSNRTKFIKTN